MRTAERRPRRFVEWVHPHLAEALATFDDDPDNFSCDELHRRIRELERVALHDGPATTEPEGSGY